MRTAYALSLILLAGIGCGLLVTLGVYIAAWLIGGVR